MPADSLWSRGVSLPTHIQRKQLNCRGSISYGVLVLQLTSALLQASHTAQVDGTLHEGCMGVGDVAAVHLLQYACSRLAEGS